MSKIGIILVMFRQKHNLELLYSSLAGQTEKDFTVYFVDNNTDSSDTDHSKELNNKYSLNIVYIASGGNNGFAGGNNLGAVKAAADGCKYIFFLNNDTILDENCLKELLIPLDTDNNIAATGPLILFWNGSKTKERVQEFGANADFNSYKIEKMYEGVNFGEYEKVIPENITADVLPGAATFIRSEALVKTGLWEESYFAYGDEIDLAKRIKDSGYKCILTKKAVLWHNHKWDKENKQGYYFEYYLIQRNKYLYFRKYGLYFNMLLAYLSDIFKFPLRLLWFIKVCDIKLGYYYLKGTYAGLLDHKGKPNLYFVK